MTHDFSWILHILFKQLSFLEFYEVLLLCTECNIQEEYEKAAKAQEASRQAESSSQPSTAMEQGSKNRPGSAETPKKKKKT